MSDDLVPVRLALASVPRQRSQLKRFILCRIAPLAVLLCAGACGRSSTSGGTPSSVGAPGRAPETEEPLGPRLEAVASADALAVAGSRASGDARLQALLRAAAVRMRLFRREHREPDGLEAIELYRQVALSRGPSRCAADLARLSLEAELNADPDATYRALYSLSLDAPADCRGPIDAALAMLQAFRPSERELALLEGARAGEPQPAASEAPVAAASSGETPSAAAPTAELLRVERYSAKDAARVVVFLSRPVRFEVGTLAGSGAAGPRLFVDIKGARYAGSASFPAGGLLERVRVAAADAGSRVVLDLSAAAEHRVFYVSEPFRLVIDVAKRDAALRPTRDVRRVVLDPGHGGHDPGAIGPTGLREKDVALDIAHRAAPLIARELGVATLLTRDADVFVPLEERTARANGFGADLFISIHCNATERSGGSGVMTFVLDESKDLLASRIAALENSASAEATSELARAMSASADRSNEARSSEFAELLQRAAIGALAPSYPDVPNGGVKRAGFYVLAGARMPAVLFETSFISSARDETRFNTGDFRQKLADAIVNAVRAYKEGRRASP